MIKLAPSDESRAERAASLLAALAASDAPVRVGWRDRPVADESVLPVSEPLRGLFPEGGLVSGTAISVVDGVVDHVGYLPMALLAPGPPASDTTVRGHVTTVETEPARQERWCAVVGVPEFGIAAAAGLGVSLERLLLVDNPGPRWPEVVAALLGAVDVVLVRPPWGEGRPDAGTVSALNARLRHAAAGHRGAAPNRHHGDGHRAALLVLGSWEGARLRLRTESPTWSGIRDGTGYLQRRRVDALAWGQGAGARPRVARLWLPDADGAVAGLTESVRTTAGTNRPSRAPLTLAATGVA
jgi:hypothetical protein